MRKLKLEDVKYDNKTGLVPAIIQDLDSGKVLMQGYMNAEALQKTLETKKVTFFSRSKNRLWMKGEESGNVLVLYQIGLDCDKDSILIKAQPLGPTCHMGSDTCWDEKNEPEYSFLYKLEKVISERMSVREKKSYTVSLFEKGINKIAQKVGEEAVELIIEAKDDNDTLFKGEAADLLYHFLVLLKAKEITLEEVLDVLKERHRVT
jgi:phosphoribosyl-ATP pyrophosphohydrolase/phosphoribosyl-AMP cyclohydrolase